MKKLLYLKFVIINLINRKKSAQKFNEKILLTKRKSPIPLSTPLTSPLSAKIPSNLIHPLYLS